MRRRLALTAAAAAALSLGLAAPSFAGPPAAEHHDGCNDLSNHQRQGRTDVVDGWWAYAGGNTVGITTDQTYAFVEVRQSDRSVAGAARWPYSGGVAGTPVAGVDVGFDTAGREPVCAVQPAG